MDINSSHYTDRHRCHLMFVFKARCGILIKALNIFSYVHLGVLFILSDSLKKIGARADVIHVFHVLFLTDVMEVFAIQDFIQK